MTTSLTRDDESEGSLRPRTLREYIGQKKAKGNLEVFIQAAKMRGEPLDHVLLHGPPGLGKTTLSGIIANEMGVNIRITSGPAIEKPGDLADLLTNLAEIAAQAMLPQRIPLLCLRTIRTLFTTVTALPIAWTEVYPLAVVLGIVGVVIGICTCVVLFGLRKALKRGGLPLQPEMGK